MKISSLYYKDKKTEKVKKLTDIISRDLQCITRPNDRQKRISLKAHKLLTNLIQMIQRSPQKEIFVDHEFLSEITYVGAFQNRNLILQIGDLIQASYYASFYSLYMFNTISFIIEKI